MHAAVANISEMMEIGAEGLVVFSQSSPSYKSYRKLSQMPKWRSYMEDVEEFIPFFQDNNNSPEEFSMMLADAGLQVDYVLNPKRFCTFPSPLLLSFYASADPFISRIPKNDRTDYLTDLRNWIAHFDPEGGETKYNFNILITRFTKIK